MNTNASLRLAQPFGAAALLVLAMLFGAASHAADAPSDSRHLAAAHRRLHQLVMACMAKARRAAATFRVWPASRPAYLARQMQDFQNGLRKYAPMEYTVRQLSPAYMQEIAEYFSAQQVPYSRSPVPAGFRGNPAARRAAGQQG